MGRPRSGCRAIAPASASPRLISTPTGTSISFSRASGGNRLLRNRRRQEIRGHLVGPEADGRAAVSLMARWLDLDQDGDLDLYVVNYCAAEHAEQGLRRGRGAAAGAPELRLSQRRPARAWLRGHTIQARAPAATAYDGRVSKQGLSIALVPWPGAEPLLGGARAHTGIAVLDVDNDRDLDLVLTADKSPPVALLNDRLGVFHEAPIEGVSAA